MWMFPFRERRLVHDQILISAVSLSCICVVSSAAKQRLPSRLQQRAQTETDESCGLRGHLAASIQTEQSIAILSFLPSAQVLPVKSLSCGVKGHANSRSIFLLLDYFIQLHLPQAHTPSLPVLSLFHSPSMMLWPIDLLGREIINGGALPWLSGPNVEYSW